MTRFARAEGSKGSNKRECEDATPWKVMKKDILVQKGNEKKTKNVNEKKTKNVNEKTKSVVLSPEGGNLKSPTNIEEENFDETLQAEQKNTKKDGKKKKGVSLEEMKKNWVIEDGKRYKIFKDGTKKPWFDLGYEENDVMTRYKNFFIKHEDVDELNQYEKSLQEQNLSDKEITKKLLYKERKLHNKLRLELLRDEIKKNKKTETNDKPTEISNKKSKKTEKNDNPTKISNKKSEKNLVKKAKRKFQPKFQENEIMTNFEGYWILRENLPHLQKVADIKFWRIINNRTDGNEERKLTAEEELVYRRLMKKEKRREMNLLQNYLKDKKNEIQSATHSEYRRQGIVKNHWQNNNNEDTVKFDGYYITKEGAERLSELKETMLAKGCTEEEIAEVMKTERRKEERVLKRTTKSFCYQCRQPGHMVSFCPENEKEGISNNYIICFKCGSAEHTAKNCKSRSNSSSSYPLATCFICKEVGHISRECPDNPKGLYPNGGCCKHCGSVEHLKRDCPELQKQKGEEMITVSVFRRGDQIEEMEDEFKNPSASQSQLKAQKVKIIKFD